MFTIAGGIILAVIGMYAIGIVLAIGIAILEGIFTVMGDIFSEINKLALWVGRLGRKP